MSPRTGHSHVAVFLLAVAATFAIPRAPSPVTAPANGSVQLPLSFVESSMSAGQIRTLNYTVPAGRQFILTDVTISNEPTSGHFGTGLAKVLFLDGSLVGSKIPPIVVQADDTVDIHYTTGPRYAAGGQITLVSAIGGTTVHCYVAGYETDSDLP